MNAGGEGRDDYGLPPVDVEVPDDARDLARDVQAYHRELRQRRRRRLARRVYEPLTRDGMVLPLLAGCLALTLLAATLLTVFTARQAAVSLRPEYPAAGTGSRPGALRSPPRSPRGATLLNAIVFAAGQAETVASLEGTVLVLALVPRRCDCLADLRQLTIQANAVNTEIYLVGVRDARVENLAPALGLGTAHALEDSYDQLPPEYRVAKLTAVLVRKDGTEVYPITDHGHGFSIEGNVRALLPGVTAPRSPGASAAGVSATAPG